MPIDKPKLIESLLKIDNKSGIIVPFRLNKMQRYFAEHKSNRNIILKHRQGGMSSYILADMFTDCITIPYTPAAVVSHETRSTQRLLDRVQSFYDNMTPPKPQLGADSRSEKTFPEMHSSIYVGTAGARAFGRGDTIRKALLSELAFYEDAEKILSGVEDAIPITGELTIECFDDKSEVLTDRGWLLFKDVQLTDMVLSKNLKTNVAYWSAITNKVERPAEELIHVTGKGIDFAVTPNHNIWVRKSGTIQSFGIHRAEDLFNYSEWEFESSLEWIGEEKATIQICNTLLPMDLWLEFMGYFLSEGWVQEASVSIYQEGEYREQMRVCIEQVAFRLDKSFGCYCNKQSFAIHSKDFATYLKNYTKPKRIPKELLDLSKRQLQILFKAYMMGDGEKKRNRCCTVSPELRDSLQELGLKLGYRSNYTIHKERTDIKGVHHKEAYTISFYKNTKSSVRLVRNQVKRESYKGMVYCLTIPEDHLLMIRRDCKVCWQGNCSPNGEDNVFYERWVKAREGKSPYTTFFFPWWWSEDYSIPRNSPYVIPEERGDLHYTDEEQQLLTQFHLTEDQIRWRRWKFSEKGGLFYQEYPEDEVSCFITIGNPVFDVPLLNDMAQRCYNGEVQYGGWTQWIAPTPKTSYIIGADSAAGAPEGSYSAAVVLDPLYRVCATYQARVNPHDFAQVLTKLGTIYNTAEIAVERNFTGYAVLEQLIRYPNVFHQRDFTTGKVTTQRGWWTNDSTRDLMMTITKEKLAQAKMWDVNLVRQLRSYRYIKLKTKFRETAQTFDDLAMAFMIACTVRKVAGVATGYRGKIPSYSW